jgi:hypothetical protein
VRRTAVAVTILAVLALAAPASGADSSWAGTAAKWASVNQCGGATMGVRASQPGDAFGSPMSTRFSAQWLNQGTWQAVPGSESPWIAAGPGPWLSRETGWDRTFVTGGRPYTVRGVVEMTWGGSRSQTLITPQTCVVR